MKKALHLAFSAYGRVIDVVVCKTAKLRGQAWVVFDNVPCATNALRGLQGVPFYDRELVSPLPTTHAPHSPNTLLPPVPAALFVRCLMRGVAETAPGHSPKTLSPDCLMCLRSRPRRGYHSRGGHRMRWRS